MSKSTENVLDYEYYTMSMSKSTENVLDYEYYNMSME